MVEIVHQVGAVQPFQGPGGGVKFHGKRDEREGCGHGKQADAQPQHPRRAAHGQQHNADHQHNAHQVGGELDDGNQRGPQAQPVVSLGVLHGMPYFMGGDGSGGNAVGIVNGLAQVDGFVRRIVMVRQMAGRGNHLHVRNMVVLQHLLRHLPPCYGNGNLGVFAEAALHARADQPAQKHGAQQNQPVNGIGMRWGGFRRLYRIRKEIDIE